MFISLAFRQDFFQPIRIYMPCRHLADKREDLLFLIQFQTYPLHRNAINRNPAKLKFCVYAELQKQQKTIPIKKEPVENNGFCSALAEDVGVEPTHGYNTVYGLAIRCITVLPVLRRF